jgi:uncharacterized protein involved in outer membrane biogenesis
VNAITAFKKPHLPADWKWPSGRLWRDLDLRGIDWSRINPLTEEPHPEPQGDGGEAKPPEAPGPHRHHRWRWVAGILGAIAVAIIAFLLIFDWNWLRGPIGRYASAQSGRTVVLQGDLKVKLLTWTPRVEINTLKIGNPAWGPKENMAEINRLTMSARWLPLFSGRLVMPLVSVEQPNVALYRDATGRANWELEPRQPAKPLQLPPIQRFLIKEGKLRVTDLGRQLTFNGTVNANEEATSAYDRGFRLEGRGDLNRRNFLLNVTGGPLINVKRDRPYPFDAEVRSGATRVTAKGQVPRPFNLGLVNAAVTVAGPDMNDLYDLTGLTFPNTPPYRVSGQLRRDGMIYTYDRFTGRVGRSDLNGDMKVDLTSGRPFLTGAMNSKLLDFADLAGLFGLPGASAAADPAQKAEARALAAQGRMLPDATLQVERLRSMDARVTYSAASVRAPSLPLEAVSLGVKLDKGVLTLDPIAFKFPTGEMSGNASIDARKDVPVSRVDLRVRNIKLEQFIPAVEGARPVTGTLLGRARLTGSGNSVHRAASNADGAVTLVIPRGQIRQAFAELMGINATKGLFLLLAKDQSPTDIRCALADFEVRNGTLVARHIVFDTGVVIVNGSGTVNLETERMDLVFKGKTKKFRAVRLIAPITMGGSLRAPKYGIQPGGAIAQAGIGVALGTLLTPLAAILPFVDPGLAKDANCQGLFAEARVSDAPVPGAAAAAGPAARPKR